MEEGVDWEEIEVDSNDALVDTFHRVRYTESGCGHYYWQLSDKSDPNRRALGINMELVVDSGCGYFCTCL